MAPRQTRRSLRSSQQPIPEGQQPRATAQPPVRNAHRARKAKAIDTKGDEVQTILPGGAMQTRFRLDDSKP